MRALLSRQPGPPETLVIEDIADPEPTAGEVVIQVAAAALNFFDTLLIQDMYQYRPERPFSPGAEVAGTVAAVGDGVSSFAPGDRVMAYTIWGAIREKIALPADHLIRVPDALDLNRAAGLIVTYGTSYYALKDRAQLRAGETVAVLGASGGVGLAAIEIAKDMNARVIACASSPEKLAVCRDHGADECIDYSTEDLKDRLKALTEGRGVDVVYDPVGGAYSEAALRATGWMGRFLVIGFASGTIPKIPLNLMLLKGCDVRGVFWGDAVARDPALHHSNMEHSVERTVAGALSARIDSVHGLDDAPAALQLLADRKAVGKVVIEL